MRQNRTTLLSGLNLVSKEFEVCTVLDTNALYLSELRH